MSKKNGKFVVIAIFGLVLAISMAAWVIQSRIDLNRGKPLPATEVEEAEH